MENTIIPKEETRTIRQELNIEKWPIFTTSNFKGKSREISREVILENGDKVKRKVIIGRTKEGEIGVLRLQDYKVFCVLTKLWEEAKKPVNEKVTFTLYELAELLELQWGGKTHKGLYISLERLKTIPIIWEDSFYQKETETIETLVTYFNLLDDLLIFERRKDTKKGQIYFSLSRFKFNSKIISNLLHNYTKPVYLDVILKFKKEISVFLYRYLDLVMADKDYYERKTQGLFNDLELSEYKYPSKRKQLLEPALEELEGVELTTGILNYAKLERTTDGKDWKVVFKKSKKRLGIEHKKEQEEINNTTAQAMEFFNQRFPDKKGMLIEGTVEKLISEYSLDKVILHISRISNDGSVNNPVGLLRMSLEKNWDLAPTKEEIQEREKQAKDEQEKKEREEQQREKERYLKEKAEEERLNKIFFSLPSEEQEKLKEEAKRLIIEQHIEDSQEKENKFFLIDTMVMIKVREILKERELDIANCDIQFGALEIEKETVDYGE